ncbi:hypothetical protein [Romboutsia ilealis]|uniref:hypothetical protein n=1 Tax=Romboutsia ilealis TaxID=1115758 RepID=UPI0026F3B784|nr:hypothetical protein [Romboutsia ilealis]
MEDKRELYDMGVWFGKNTKTNKVQREHLVNLIQTDRNAFIENLLKLAVENKIHIPDALIVNKEDFVKNAQMFLLGMQNGAIGYK